jgi:mersacidin/lichenicidin family type 2 lantibiotic
MSVLDVIRAWKDPAYRHSLTAEQRALLPSHPAGAIELSAPAAQEGGGVAVMHRFTPCRRCASTVGRR